MGHDCTDCLPCKQGLPCGGAHGATGAQGYMGIRRITNWGTTSTPNGVDPASGWIVSGANDLPALAQIIEQDVLNDGLPIEVYDQIQVLSKQMVDGSISKIAYLNKVEDILKPLGFSTALGSVTTVLTHCRKKAVLYGGGAMLGGLILSGGVSMTASQKDDYAHILSVLAFGYGGFTLAKAYGII